MKQLKKKKLSGPKGYVSSPRKGAVPVVLSINDDYVLYAGVTICSIKEYARKDRIYDVYVMYTQLTTGSIRKLEALSEDHFRVRCVDVSPYLNGYVLEDKMNKKLWYISQETYYRFLIPDIFKGYDKIIYLDADLIVRDDLANLYNTKLGNDLLGGCYDSLYRKEANYVRNVLKIDPHFYINAGVLLIHAKLWRNEKIGDKCFKALSKYAGIIKYQDQDILNIVCQNRIRLIDYRWNFIYSLWILSNSEYLKYLKNNLFDKKDLKIIHYTWWQKPWICPENEMADIWWGYARRSPFYKEIILKKRTAPLSLSCKSPLSSEIIKKIQIDDPYIYPILVQYIKEAFLSLISWGKKRKYYSESMRVLRAIIGQRIESNCLSEELSCENKLLLRQKHENAVRQKRSFLLKVKRGLLRKRS